MRTYFMQSLRSYSIVLLILTLFISCKNKEDKIEEVATETPQTEIQTQQIYHGEFIYTPEAAVLSGKSFVYGVELNEVARELANRVNAVKKDDYDIVPVAVQGKVTKKPEGAEGWDEIITITQIINVSETAVEADVKI